MKRFFGACICAVSLFVSVAAEDGFGNPGERFGRREGRGGMEGHGGMRRNRNMGGGMMFKRVIAEEELAQKYPAEMAAIFAARIKQEEEMSALAAKAGVELPASTDISMLKVRNADPKGFAEAVAMLKTSPREGMTKLREIAQKAGIELFRMPGRRNGENGVPGGDASGPRAIGRVDLKALRQKFPEEMKEYERLRKEDGAKAREYLMSLVERDQKSAKEK